MIFAEYGCDKAKTEVHDFLPSFSKRGSGDDVSIAGLVRATISEETVRLIKAQIESENATASYTKIDKECVIAREKVEYINVALKKTRETLLDNEAKLKKAEAECDQKEIEKAAAKKRFDDASAALSAAFEAFKNDNSAKENTSQNSKEPTEQ